MNDDESREYSNHLLGSVEPHFHLLKVPSDGQLLYKVQTVENLLNSIKGSYLHFNRIDRYPDFPGVDENDGAQLPGDYKSNNSSKFESNPEFSAADYYDQSRARTYACCFSLSHSDYIWSNYGNGSSFGKVGVVFEFNKLRQILNDSFSSGNLVLLYNGTQVLQFFSINYGVVDYVHRDSHRANLQLLPNPILYSFLKDKEFENEKEMRITMSALGTGKFVISGSELLFPDSIQVYFDFKAAIQNGIITEFLTGRVSNFEYFTNELKKLSIDIEL